MEVKKNAFRLVRGRLAFVDESVIYKKTRMLEEQVVRTWTGLNLFVNFLGI